MRVLVITGSRYGTSHVAELTREILASDLVIHGGAPGVDRMADAIAREHGIHVLEVKALWDHYGKHEAGKQRNVVLDLLGRDLRRAGNTVRFAAYPGPESKGTWHAVNLFRVVPPIEGNIYKDTSPRHPLDCACSQCENQDLEARR